MGAPLQIEENVALGPLTTLRVGGAAQYFVRVADEAELLAAVEFARGRGLPIFPLGGGSNLLVADGGYPGLVLQMAFLAPTVRDGDVFRVAAGTGWDDFVLEVCRAGLSGVECLAGIPGWVGGSPIQNIGAYGQEAAETLQSVEALDLRAMRFVRLTREQCGFGYRRSVFNTAERGRYLVTAVRFAFDPAAVPRVEYADLRRIFAAAAPSPMEVYEAVREIRRGKGMLLVDGDPDCRSAGSFFKNPVVEAAQVEAVAEAAGVPLEAVPRWSAEQERVKLSAAWLVERAGFGKGFQMGAAGISSRHSLALINRGGATCREMVALREAVRCGVRERFRVELEQEPVEVGAISSPDGGIEVQRTSSATGD